MRPERRWIRRTQRVEVRNREAVAVPYLREAAASANSDMRRKG
jgi:hypothetical protein